MDPVALHIGPLAIRWYGIMAACGFLSGVVVARLNAKLVGIKEDYVTDLTVISILSGIVGARIFYVVQFWHRDGFDQHFAQVFRVDNGGLVYYGGFLLAITAIYIYSRIRKVNVVDMFDVLAPAMPIGHAFGRIGCFINGCCFGKPCGEGFPFGVRPPAFDVAAQGMRIHPVQLYESALNVVIFIVLFTLFRKRVLGRGGVVGLYFIFYGVSRFLLEFFRGDHRDFLFGMTPAQNIGMVLIPFGAWLVWRSLKIRPAVIGH